MGGLNIGGLQDGVYVDDMLAGLMHYAAQHAGKLEELPDNDAVMEQDDICFTAIYAHSLELERGVWVVCARYMIEGEDKFTIVPLAVIDQDLINGLITPKGLTESEAA